MYVLRWSPRLIRFCVASAFALLAVAVGGPAAGQAQDVALRGFVVDAETGRPLVGANVVLRRLAVGRLPRGAVTNGDGYYRVAGLAPGERYVLRVSFVGYRTVHDTLYVAEGEERVTRSFRLRATERALEEVVVTGEASEGAMLEAARQQVAAADIARIPTPSVSGDLAGYLQSLPGMVMTGDRGGQLFIRGGTPDQNLVLMDKMPVYRPFHIVGFYSAFPQDLISRAEIYAGGFPAEYSGRISSVIDVEMRGGNQERFEAAATAGPFLTGVRAEGPLNGAGLSLLAAARFSQIERTAPRFLGQEQPLKFGDRFVKLQHATETGRCAVTGLHTYDRGRIDVERDDVFRWSNFAFGGRCVGVTSGSSSVVDVSTSVSYVSNAAGRGDEPERQASLWHVNTSANLVAPLEGRSEIRGGFHARVNKLAYSLGEKFQGFRTGHAFMLDIVGYASATLPLGRSLDVRPGLALTLPFDYGLGVEPRLRAQWRPFGTDAQTLNAAFGFYRQTVVGLSDERDLGSVFTAWMPAPFERSRPYAWHAILGWRQQLGSFRLTAEGYYKDLGNLAVPIWSTIARFTTELATAEGTSRGLDLRGTFERGPVYAFLGYGLSWTRYAATQDNFGTWFGAEIQTYHPPHDRRHELNAVVSTDLGFLIADVRWQFGSGLPYTQPFGFDSIIRLQELEQDPRRFYGTPRLLYEKPYRGRLPAYHRLDVSLERTFDLGAASLTAKAGGINLYDRQNLFYFDLFTLQRVDQLPFVPYLAVEVVVD